MKKYEIIHYISQSLKIFSNFRTIYFEKNRDVGNYVRMPLTKFDILSLNLRILKRFFRTDKCNVYVLDESRNEYLIIRQGKVFFLEDWKLDFLFNLKQCRNILHVDLCRTPTGNLYFGEYGANLNRDKVPIYCSKDRGKTWEIIYWFEANTIKHIHCVKYDPFSDKIWVFTGDKEGECKILVTDEDFKEIKIIGDGTQKYRACNVFFEETRVVWMMDSPNETAYCVHFDRVTEQISLNFAFNGPVWYSHELEDGYYICATSIEPGYSMKEKTAQVLISKNLVEWKVMLCFQKDIWPVRLFKNGVIAFPIGKQSIVSVSMFGEALKKIEGIVKTYDFRR